VLVNVGIEILTDLPPTNLLIWDIQKCMETRMIRVGDIHSFWALREDDMDC
jgi:hypothetical protein